jgi:RimJ/RimL family protein N-acetyltransferase
MIRYPKVYRAKDGRAIVVRPASADDVTPLVEFFLSLPEEDRLHLRVDVTQRDVMHRRLKDQPHWEVVRLMGIFGNDVVAECSIAHRTYGFESHVGEMRLLVAPDFRRSGLATYLGRQIFAHAIMMDLEKIEAAVMADDAQSVRCIKQLGFEREGVLKGFVKDVQGNNHDLLMLSLST